MTISTTVETTIGNLIDSLGSTVSIVQQTATTGADEYHQTVNRWVNYATVSAHAIVLPPLAKSPFGMEFSRFPMGEMQQADYQAWFEATHTIEVSQSGTSTITKTRYKVVHNSQDYEITQLKPWEFQDNVFMKHVLLKLITA